MPAFVFVSGYFGKRSSAKSVTAILKLLFLFYIFNGALGLIMGFDSLLEPVYSYWYLMALIIWRLTAHYLSRIKGIVVALFAIAIIIGFCPSIDNTLALSRTIGFYPFYMLGYKLSETRSKSFENKKYSIRAFYGMICLSIVLVAVLCFILVIKYEDRVFSIVNYKSMKDIIRRLLFFSVSIVMIMTLRCFSINKKVPFLSMIGKNSLWIFLFHRPFTIVISNGLKGGK